MRTNNRKLEISFCTVKGYFGLAVNIVLTEKAKMDLLTSSVENTKDDPS